MVLAENSNLSVMFRLRHTIPSSLMKQQTFQSLSSLGYIFNTSEKVGNTCVKYLKLMELSKGTADVITDAIVDT